MTKTRKEENNYMLNKTKIEEEFNEKFSFRIYGIAGEPKTEFLEPKNKPEEIRNYLLSVPIDILASLEKKVEEMIVPREGTRMKEIERYSSYNQALDEVLELLRKAVERLR